MARMQVQLYAELQPEALLPFLAASQSYSLEPALAVCEQYGLVPEQVMSSFTTQWPCNNSDISPM
jgi:vacuolar protein sorting-associated protein 41